MDVVIEAMDGSYMSVDTISGPVDVMDVLRRSVNAIIVVMDASGHLIEVYGSHHWIRGHRGRHHYSHGHLLYARGRHCLTSERPGRKHTRGRRH